MLQHWNFSLRIEKEKNDLREFSQCWYLIMVRKLISLLQHFDIFVICSIHDYHYNINKYEITIFRNDNSIIYITYVWLIY